MKLLFCPECGAMFSLRIGITKTCDCGRVSGQYNDRCQAEVNGKGIAVAIGNGSLHDAIYRMQQSKHMHYADRDHFKDSCRVEYCWVRPHEGPGNPHTTVAKQIDARQGQETT